MRVLVYVEGPSDVLAMEALLAQLIARKARKGVLVEFFEAPPGDKKRSLLARVPVKAVSILMNEPGTIVIAMPDLYPRNKGFPHSTFDELRSGIERNYETALRSKLRDPEPGLLRRFRVFCFKYELEALLPAAEDALLEQAGLEKTHVTRKRPVEDQNFDRPPKQVVEEVFAKGTHVYRETVDARAILERADLDEIIKACPQCFAPFVQFIESLTVAEQI